MAQSQTYWDKNKGRSLEGTLEKYTKIGIAIFFIVTAVTWFIKF
jgi:preprotein translocase subunit SecG